jgi:hypothetical protein
MSASRFLLDGLDEMAIGIWYQTKSARYLPNAMMI